MHLHDAIYLSSTSWIDMYGGMTAFYGGFDEAGFLWTG
jgi:hypothetical protein